MKPGASGDSPPPKYYPIFLDLTNQSAVVIGGGRVALRKTRGLLEAGAVVTAVSPAWDPAFEVLPVTRVTRPFEDADLEGARLVFAATNDREVNHRVAELAKAKGIFANIADAPAECGFVVPARVQHGNVQIAISTGGESPSLAAQLRKDLAEWLKTR